MPVKPQTILRRVRLLPEYQSKLYLEFKDQHFEKVEKYKQDSNELLAKIYNLTTERGDVYEKQKLQSELIRFNKLIRQGSHLQKKLETFQLTNLANYDPSHTSVQYTRSYNESHKQLDNWVKEFKAKRLRLQESLVGYEKRMP